MATPPAVAKQPARSNPNHNERARQYDFQEDHPLTKAVSKRPIETPPLPYYQQQKGKAQDGNLHQQQDFDTMMSSPSKERIRVARERLEEDAEPAPLLVNEKSVSRLNTGGLSQELELQLLNDLDALNKLQGVLKQQNEEEEAAFEAAGSPLKSPKVKPDKAGIHIKLSSQKTKAALAKGGKRVPAGKVARALDSREKHEKMKVRKAFGPGAADIRHARIEKKVLKDRHAVSKIRDPYDDSSANIGADPNQHLLMRDRSDVSIPGALAVGAAKHPDDIYSPGKNKVQQSSEYVQYEEEQRRLQEEANRQYEPPYSDQRGQAGGDENSYMHGYDRKQKYQNKVNRRQQGLKDKGYLSPRDQGVPSRRRNANPNPNPGGVQETNSLPDIQQGQPYGGRSQRESADDSSLFSRNTDQVDYSGYSQQQQQRNPIPALPAAVQHQQNQWQKMMPHPALPVLKSPPPRMEQHRSRSSPQNTAAGKFPNLRV